MLLDSHSSLVSAEGRDQADEKRFVGKQARDAGAASDFLIHSFQRVGGAPPFLMACQQRKHREARRQVWV